MSKKQYQTPTMKVVEFEVEQHLLTASLGTVGTQQFTVGESYDDESLW